ncbi:hypothetical protein [Sulfobacillus sp. hq2]|uniref:hypothetical protein n=1 Tax=Sulfobacillus TaxID=28033 RepID=UPI00156ECED7|nr:hypothetical protein [Sulfobacillus sp. hq2]MCY0909259.1 hypothetical protein [Sulfobacillus thermotolerans]
MEFASQRKPGKVRNEAVFLYDMNADDLFESQGYLVIDSSLGMITSPVPPVSPEHQKMH